ncbi:hypothetical protein ACHAP8_009377 [Fusarium lateritium]
MKATLFVSILLSLGVSATPAVDTTTIEDGGYTYTGIDKTVPQESVSVQEITAAGLVAVDVCSASLDLALDSAGLKRFRDFDFCSCCQIGWIGILSARSAF